MKYLLATAFGFLVSIVNIVFFIIYLSHDYALKEFQKDPLVNGLGLLLFAVIFSTPAIISKIITLSQKLNGAVSNPALIIYWIYSIAWLCIGIYTISGFLYLPNFAEGGAYLTFAWFMLNAFTIFPGSLIALLGLAIREQKINGKS